MKHSSSLIKAIISMMAFIYVLNSTSFASAQTVKKDESSKVYTTILSEHGLPLTIEKLEFDCSDKIYSVVELANYKRGRHELSVRWIDPNDTTRENTQYPFHVLEDEVKLWAWLSLSRARGAGMLQWLNPAAGLEEFIGPWKIEVRIDGNKIATKTFEVSC